MTPEEIILQQEAKNAEKWMKIVDKLRDAFQVSLDVYNVAEHQDVAITVSFVVRCWKWLSDAAVCWWTVSTPTSSVVDQILAWDYLKPTVV